MSLKVEYGPFTQQKPLQKIADYVASDIGILNEELQKKNIIFATVNRIRVCNGTILVGFMVKTLEDLYKFKQKSDEQVLTEVFTEYSHFNSLEVVAGFPHGKKMNLHLEMDRDTHLRGQLFFEELQREETG